MIMFLADTYRPAAGLAAILLAAAIADPARAAIDNTATASGTYNGNPVSSAPDSEAVPVEPKAPSLSVVKSAGAPSVSAGVNAAATDAGDTIVYTYTVTNTGNVTISAATPVDAGPTFNGQLGTGSLGSFILTGGSLPVAPGASVTFEAVYTLSALDAYRAAGVTDGVSNSATAQGQDPQGQTVTSATSTATATIAAAPGLSVAKLAILDDTNGTAAGLAEAGETITYLYTITNTGNVPVTGVTVNDTHEGAPLAASVFGGEALSSDGPLGGSTDATADDGIWDTLAAGATVTITYVHTVTQPEVDDQ
jgi:uncharacterized repeat protein (TIGR01451 family)